MDCNDTNEADQRQVDQSQAQDDALAGCGTPAVQEKLEHESGQQQPSPSLNPYNPYEDRKSSGAPLSQSSQTSQDQQQPVRPPYQTPEPNRRYPQVQPGYEEVKKVQNLALAASVCGPVSVFFGGMLLSGAGIVCAFMGMRKADKVEAKSKDIEDATKRARKSCIVAMVVCAVAFVLNALYAFYMYPVLLAAVETGDLSSLFGGSAVTGGGTGSGTSSSTWG